MLRTLLCITLISLLSANAQTSKDLLSGKDWCIEGRTNQITGMRFEGNEVIYFTELEERQENRCPYYFSDTKDSSFLNSKIGKATSGQYLIIKSYTQNRLTGQWENGIIVLKINKLTAERLEIIPQVTGVVIPHYAR